MAASDFERLDLSDEDTEDLFGSPSAKEPKTPTNDTDTSSNQRNGESKYDAQQARNAALEKELKGVRNINAVIEGVISSLETAKGNMDVSRPIITMNCVRYMIADWI